MVDFPPYLTRGTTFVTSCDYFTRHGPYEKGVYFKKKEYAPKGVYSFLSEGKKMILVVTSF